MLSLELTVPETELLELSVSVKVLVVRVELSITSLKVAEMLGTPVVAPSDGEVDETVGTIPSITISLLAPIDPDSPGEDKVRIESLVALSRMVPLFAERESVAL